jgi:hypothetical protein
VLGGEVHGSDAAVARGQRLHVRDRLGAVEAGPGRQARSRCGAKVERAHMRSVSTVAKATAGDVEADRG